MPAAEKQLSTALFNPLRANICQSDMRLELQERDDRRHFQDSRSRHNVAACARLGMVNHHVSTFSVYLDIPALHTVTMVHIYSPAYQSTHAIQMR